MIYSGGSSSLPLHWGKLPNFFSERMGAFSEAILESVLLHHGKSEVLTRLSDPNWFQALAACGGMHWQSSGSTSAVLGSVRRRINRRANELGLFIAGGKARQASYAPAQLERYSNKTGLNGTELVRSCNLSRRVDQGCVQDSYNLYQHFFIVSDEGDWAAISQGMNTDTRRARRYHWRSTNVRDFCSDPHSGIVGTRGGRILNLADSRAESTREHIVELTQEEPSKIVAAARGIEFGDYHEVRESDVNLKRLGAVLAMAHGNEISNFSDLVMLRGIGPHTLKALALASELIYSHDSARFDDPARFSFAINGKDGQPGPLDRKTYDETIQHLQDSVEQSKLGFGEKSKALKNLHRATKKIEDTKSPEADIEAYTKSEWERLEKDGGYTFMGKVIPGVTKVIMGLANTLLYDTPRGKTNAKKD